MIYLIPAAGKGTRAGLPYPKCLHKYKGKEILIRTLEKLSTVSKIKNIFSTIVILIPAGKNQQFISILERYTFDNLNIHLEQQFQPRGTASAVFLSYAAASTLSSGGPYNIIWGDCIGFSTSTLLKTLDCYKGDIVIPGLYMKKCYTLFTLEGKNKVIDCNETKKLKISPSGYTDVGVFKVNNELVLSNNLKRFIDNSNDIYEDSFIDFLSNYCKKSGNVNFLNCCKTSEKKGFNSFEDLNDDEDD